MSSDDNIFLDAPVSDVATWLPSVLGAKPLAGDWVPEGQHLFAVVPATAGGELAILLAPNTYGDVDPESEDISAIDDYATDLDVRLSGVRDEEAQPRECRLIFDRLVAARPDVPMLLVTSLSTLIAAHWPGVSTHVFEESISPDYPDLETWRPWVRGWRDGR